MSSKFCNTYAAAAEATGLSVWTLKAMKLAARGQPDSPFIGRLIEVERLKIWLRRHPEFVPSQTLRHLVPNPAPEPRVKFAKRKTDVEAPVHLS